MSTLKDKSKMNLKAALLLTSEVDLCPTSIHCAYYSCYQLIIYFLETKLKLSDIERNKAYGRYKRDERETGGTKILGSHEFWITQFINDYRVKKPAEVLSLYYDLSQLRQARLAADYKTTDYDKDQTDALCEKALRITKMITKTYES